MARLRSVARRTIADLGLNMSAEEVIASIAVEPQSDILTISATMNDPKPRKN